MIDPTSRMGRRRQTVKRQVKFNAGGNNFFENFRNEVQKMKFENGQSC